MYEIDRDCQLHKDLVDLRAKSGDSELFIEMEFTFPSDFPFSPPFVRILRPYVTGGHVTHGGSLCAEVLMPQGWSPAYSMESLLMQISGILTETTSDPRGPSRIFKLHPPPTQFNMSVARTSFNSATAYHKDHGFKDNP